jgi:hypothetical protein
MEWPLLLRVSDAGHCSLGTILHGRHPKPFTISVILRYPEFLRHRGNFLSGLTPADTE